MRKVTAKHLRFRIGSQSKSFIFLLAASIALPSLSIDSCLASLPVIGVSLGVHPADTVAILSLFMVGFAGGQLAFGPLSDRIGRRPALLFGCVLFAVAAVGCACAPTLTTLAFWRFVQGLGAAAGSVITFAIIRDLFSGAAGRSRLSYISVVGTIAPIVAPTVGGLIATWQGWRAVFFWLAAAGALLVIILFFSLEESLPTRNRHALRPRHLVTNYWRVLSHRTCLLYLLIGGFSFGALFAYVSGSAFVFIDVFGVDPRIYGALFAVNAFAIAVGAFISGRLTTRGVSTNRLIIAGLLISFCATSALFGGAIMGWLNAFSIMPLLILNTFSMGLVTPNAVHGTMEPMPRIAGVASSAFGSIRMLGGAISSEFVAIWYRGTPVAMGETMALFAACSLFVGLLLIQPRRRQGERRERAETIANALNRRRGEKRTRGYTREAATRPNRTRF
jgi:MFS transporter, DHA1 family, multidrug resistance protein